MSASLAYLLDTNILSDLVRNPQGVVAGRIAEAGEYTVCTSVIVAAELRYGATKSNSEKLAAGNTRRPSVRIITPSPYTSGNTHRTE